MLSEVARKYETYKKNNYKQIESLKQAIDEEAEAKTIRALKVQNHKVAKIHSNQQEIQTRLKRNAQLENELTSHLQEWLKMYETVHQKLKEAGDLVNYAEYIEEQIKQVSGLFKSKIPVLKPQPVEEKSGQKQVGEKLEEIESD